MLWFREKHRQGLEWTNATQLSFLEGRVLRYEERKNASKHVFQHSSKGESLAINYEGKYTLISYFAVSYSQEIKHKSTPQIRMSKVIYWVRTCRTFLVRTQHFTSHSFFAKLAQQLKIYRELNFNIISGSSVYKMRSFRYIYTTTFQCVLSQRRWQNI